MHAIEPFVITEDADIERVTRRIRKHLFVMRTTLSYDERRSAARAVAVLTERMLRATAHRQFSSPNMRRIDEVCSLIESTFWGAHFYFIVSILDNGRRKPWLAAVNPRRYLHTMYWFHKQAVVMLELGE